MSSPIRCENLSKRFGRVSAVESLALDVPEGSIYALIGPNGAGKTTLIKMLVNIVQPSGGRCLVLDTDTRRLGPGDYARIGYVSENQELPEWMTIDYFLAYLKPFYSSWDDELAAELVREFELPGNRRLGQLSRGMKMKAALASSLAYHPRLILLDEPFTGLDVLVRDELIAGLLERASDTTILVSSHDLGEVESFASHAGYMDAGRLHCSEETAALYGRFREIEVAVGALPAMPANLPNSWSTLERSDNLVRFVESHFDNSRTASDISQCFPGAGSVSIRPMSLREIFISLAKAGRHARREE